MTKKTNPWKEAIIQACIVNFLEWDENDPVGTLSKLIGWENLVALNPSVSKAAYALLMTQPPEVKSVADILDDRGLEDLLLDGELRHTHKRPRGRQRIW